MTDISNPEQLRRQTLDLLRFPLAIVVMLIHIWPGPSSIDPQFCLLKLFCVTKSGFLSDQSVPIYFFIAGYVFFYNVDFNKETYIKKLKNRTKTLLIPYIIWNTIALVSLMLSQKLLHPASFEPNISLRSILDCYWNNRSSLFGDANPNASSPIDPPLWFVRNLIIIVLFTPVLYNLIKHLKHYFIITLGIIWFLSNYIIGDTHFFAERLLSGIFFFSYGAYMSIHRRDMLIEFGRYFKSSMIIYPSLCLLYIIASYTYPETCSIIKGANILVGLMFAYNLSSWLLRKGYCKVSPFLASSAFFIYVSHALIIGYIFAFQKHLINPNNEIRQIIMYLLTSIMTAGILLGVFYLLRRYTPNLLKVLIGRK